MHLIDEAEGLGVTGQLLLVAVSFGNSNCMLTDLAQLLALSGVHLHLLLKLHHFLVPQILLHFIVLLSFVLQQLRQIINLLPKLQDRIGAVFKDILAWRPFVELLLKMACLRILVDLVVDE